MLLPDQYIVEVIPDYGGQDAVRFFESFNLIAR